MASGTISLGGSLFINATPSEAATLETLCPFAGATKLALYYVTGGYISDAPITGTTATAYVVCFGGSATNHLHILFYSSGSNTIGRVFIRGTRSGTAEDWYEIDRTIVT